MSDDNKIYFVVEAPVADEATTIDSGIEGERDGRRDTGGGWSSEPRRSRVDALAQSAKYERVGVEADKLKSQMQALVATMNDLVDTAPVTPAAQPAHGLQLEEITLSVQVNGKGELSIFGAGGEIGGSGGITLKFARPKP